VTVIRDGNIVGTYEMKDLNISTLVEKMTGKHISAEIVREDTYQQTADNVLELQHVTAEGMFDDISLTVGKGEIVGVAGLIGAGKTELAKAIFGALPKPHHVTGKMIFDGKEVDLESLGPSKCTTMGIGLVTEDRQAEGIISEQSVLFNTILSAFRRIVKGFVIIDGLARKLTQGIIRDVGLRPPEPDRPVHLLSGGNQQKVVIGKWLAAESKLLILDEPTRGVDVGAREEIYMVVRRQANEKGLGVLLLSSDLREIRLASDRIVVMRLGKITHELLPHETSDKQLLHLVLGEKEEPVNSN
jgi:ABC-type sugar transport system ATPase subunit